MAKLPCGCEFTDHRPGGEFLLFAAETELGRSELEYEDYEDAIEGAWLRSGSFTPTEAYYQFQDLFQQQSRARIALACAQIAAEQERHGAEIEALEQRLHALRLRLVHPDGTEIPVATFRLDDCAYTITDDPRELQVVIRDKSVHDRFFSQPVAF
jgi:hypothetical protein